MRGHFLAHRHKQHGYNMIRSGVLLIDWQHARYLRLRLRYCYYSLRSLRSRRPRPRQKPRDGAGPRPGAATASDDAGNPGGLEAPPADDLEEPAAETGDGEEKAAEAGDGQEKAAEAADGKEKPALKAPKVAGKASGSNFAGRTPPNNPPYSTRFQCCKKTWVEILGIFCAESQLLQHNKYFCTAHGKMSSSGRFIRRSSPDTIKSPRLRSFVRGAAGLCYHIACIFRLSSTFVRCWAWKVHWWKYVLGNLDLAICVTEQEIQTRMDELVGLYVVPYEQKLHTGP